MLYNLLVRLQISSLSPSLSPCQSFGNHFIRLVQRTNEGFYAMAITQIHTHRRNRHGSWRDGEGGALDALRPLGYFSERRR